LHCFRREPHDTIAHADEALELAAGHGFPFWQAMGSTLRGWALAASARDATGLSQMRQGLETFERLGVQIGRTAILALLTDACDATGNLAEGLRALDDADARVTTSGERFYAAEILRLRGELMLRQDGARAARCERLFCEAIEVARRQEARSWELRAAISLARLRRSTTRAKHPAELLAPVHAWFKEGFDTPDLVDAKALLDGIA
jgi:predicted ATPase